MADQQEMEIGTLKSIRFQGENGFIIASFEHEKKFGEFAGLGNMINPELGIAYKLFGNWDNNSKFGKQFKFAFYNVLQPNDTKGIFKYLVRVCKWIGPTVAGRIVDKYGTESLEILKASPQKVSSEIRGLTFERAMEIQENLKANEYIETVLVELEQIFAPISGIRKSLPMEIIKIWASDSVSRIRENPYILTRIKGVGFPTADKVALQLGFDRKSSAREKAAVWHVINENMHSNGSIWMRHSSVCEAVTELTGLSGTDGLMRLSADKIIVGESGMWAIAKAAEDESYIAAKVNQLIGERAHVEA